MCANSRQQRTDEITNPTTRIDTEYADRSGKIYDARGQVAYTVTVLRNAPDEKAAEAFVNYLLSKPGVTLMRKEGLTVVKPRLIGPLASVPRSLRHLIPTP